MKLHALSKTNNMVENDTQGAQMIHKVLRLIFLSKKKVWRVQPHCKMFVIYTEKYWQK